MSLNKRQPKIRSVKFNVVMNMLLTSSSFIFPLITVPYVSRVLGPSGTGIVSWGQSFVIYFSAFAMLGVGTYGTRECAKVRDNYKKLSQTVQELVIILLISTTIVTIIYLVLIFVIPKMYENKEIMLIYCAGIWLTACGCDWFYRAIEQYGYITIRNIIFKLVGLILMFLLIHNADDYKMYAAVVVIGSYGSNIFNIIRLRKLVSFSKNYKINIKRHFKPMASFTISTISVSLYTQIDLIMTGFLASNFLTGLYQLVSKIRGLCYTAVNSVGNVMLPRFAYYVSTSKNKEIAKLVGKNLNFLFIASLGIMNLLIICRSEIIIFLGGPEYLNAQLILAIVSPAILFSAANSILSQYLIATGRERPYAITAFASLIFCTLCCALLIPRFGIIGTAISTVSCEFLQTVINILLAKDFLRTLKPELDLGRIIVSAILSFILMYIVHMQFNIHSSILMIFVEGLTLIITYMAFLLVFREKFITNIINGLIKKRH